MGKFIDITGQRFGRGIVQKHIGSNKHKRAVWELLCECGNTYTTTGNDLLTNKTKSCGCLRSETSRKTMIGKSRSEETKNKISEANKGRLSGKNNPNYGIVMSDLVRDKISETLKGKYVGENSPCWNPNLTEEERHHIRHYPEYNDWRKAVYYRDYWTCQKCGYKGKNICAHHIESYTSNKELRTCISNGITLCNTCHKDLHHKYGYGNNSRDQLNKFMGEQ
jgi:hypothetical protein